jgi:hypothetical protein
MAMTHAWHDLVADMRDEMHDLATITHADKARQAYLALWGTFMLLPLLFGLDKFGTVMTSSWESYLSTWANDLLPGDATTGMYWVGAIEIALAVIVALVPRVGGDLFALWSAVVAINLFSVDGYHELAVAALALGLCALAMARMSRAYHHTEG